LEKSAQFLFFFGKMTPYGKIFKILFQSFHRHTGQHLVFKFFLNLADAKLAKVIHYLPDKKMAILAIALLCLDSYNQQFST